MVKRLTFNRSTQTYENLNNNNNKNTISKTLASQIVQCAQHNGFNRAPRLNM